METDNKEGLESSHSPTPIDETTSEKAPAFTDGITPKTICKTENSPNVVSELDSDKPGIDNVESAESDDDAVIPPGPWSFLNFPRRHSVSADGIWIKAAGKKSAWTAVTSAPLWISRVLENVSTGVDSLQMAWQTRDGQVHFHDLTEEQRSDKREFAALIGSVNAPLYVQHIAQAMDYLQRLYRLNEQQLQRVFIASRLGWSNLNGRLKFVLASSDTVQLSPESQNLVHYAASFHAVGSLEGWVTGIRPTLERCPGLSFLLLASLSSPLLTVLGAPSFTAEIWGKTSSGKTSSLNVIASVWGKIGTGSAGLVGSWDNTAYYVEQLLSFNNAVPAFLMDCHKAKPEVLENVSYQLANGFGKGRGMKIGGMRKRATWNCVLLSDGEKSLYSAFQNDGAKARVLSWYGSPLADLTAIEVQQVVTAATDNYGQLAPAFLAALDAADHEALKSKYIAFCEEFFESCQSGVESRSAQYFAAMKVALEVVATVPGMEWFKMVGESALMAARQQTTAELHESTASHTALEAVAEWVSANQYHFFSPTKHDPIQNIYGHVVLSEGYHAFYSDPLQKVLTAAGYDVKSVLREWRERGYLVLDQDKKRNTKVVRLNGKLLRLVCIKTDALFPPEESTLAIQVQVTQ